VDGLAPPVETYFLIEDDQGFDEILSLLDGEVAIGVDTESDSMYSYREKVCLVQISTTTANIILDVLKITDISPLAPIFADPGIRKVMHGSDYDIVCLKRDFGFTFGGTFDTMVAGLLLGDEHIGLGDMVEEVFDVKLAKAHTKSNWGRRPLSSAQLTYVYEDTLFLVPLAERMEERLAERDLVEEAHIEFRRLEHREPPSKSFEPQGFYKIKGAKTLSPKGLAILKELYAYREKRSSELDRPPFKVIANDTLVRVANAAPRDMSAMRRLKGITEYVAKRFGRGILGAVDRGRSGPPPGPPKKKKSTTPRLSPREQERFGRLKEWRKVKAEALTISPIAVLPNYALHEVVRARPKDRPALSAISGVGSRRAAKYGDELIPLIRGQKN
jgi:ribonuclease D